MRPTDYGPVPVSRLKSEQAAIFNALEGGRRVLVSKRGEVVAVIDPSDAIPRNFLIDYVMPGKAHFNELTATEFNQGSPSRAIADTMKGLMRYVTRNRQVFGMLRPVTQYDLVATTPSGDEVRRRAQRIQEFLSQHPDADADQLAAFSDTLDRELDRSGTLAEGVLVDVRAQIQETAQLLGQRAGQVVEDSPAVDASLAPIVQNSVRERVTEAAMAAVLEVLVEHDSTLPSAVPEP